MRRAAIAVAVFLSGCGLAQQAQLQALQKTADEQYAVELAECARRFPDQKRGLEVEHRKCRGDASLRHAQALPRAPNVDLVRLANAKAFEDVDDVAEFHAAQGRVYPCLCSVSRESSVLRTKLPI